VLEQGLLLLKAEGYNVTAAQIPLTSLKDDIAVTRRLLDAHKSRHSRRPFLRRRRDYGRSDWLIAGEGSRVHHGRFGLDEKESLASLSQQGPPSPGFGCHRGGRQRIPVGSIARKVPWRLRSRCY